MFTKVIPPGSTQCNSTEELLKEIEKTNKDNISKEWVVCSLDVEALYPSLDIQECSRVIEKELFQSDFDIKGLKWTEIALYLRYHLTDKEIEDLQITNYCPVRTTKKGRPPTFVASGSDTDITKRLGPWTYKNIEPSEQEIKKMFCRAIGVMITRTMSLHDYVFDGKIIRQRSGGSIGLDLTGVVADIYMCHWDKIFKERLLENGIITKLYERYKDDIDLLLENNKENGKEQSVKENNTIKECILIANSIHPSIQLTGDIPSNYPDNRLPILDLKVWIGEVQPEVYKIITSHYIKDVSTRAVINSRSSHPVRMKKNVMTNEIMRILRNCNEFCPWEEVAQHISYFMKRLQFSGYDQDFRYEVAKKGMWKHRLKQQQENTRSLDQQQPTMSKKKKWFQKSGNADAVMFVPATEDEELKKEVQRCADRNKMNLKVIEKVENSITKELQKSDPFKQDKCGRTKCKICDTNTGVNCRARGCVYQMTCEECVRRYRGQTGVSAQERINKHYDDWKNKVEACPLYRHSQLYHGGGTFPVSVQILKNCFGDPTTRKITEAVLIDELSKTETMNGKNEWSYVKLNKVSLQT